MHLGALEEHGSLFVFYERDRVLELGLGLSGTIGELLDEGIFAFYRFLRIIEELLVVDDNGTSCKRRLFVGSDERITVCIEDYIVFLDTTVLDDADIFAVEEYLLSDSF